MADTLPIDQGDSRGHRADLIPVRADAADMVASPMAWAYQTSVALRALPAAVVGAEVRRIRAEEHLTACAAAVGMTAEEYRLAGLLAEQHHQLLDLDADSVCPFTGATTYPYLRTGGQS